MPFFSLYPVIPHNSGGQMESDVHLNIYKKNISSPSTRAKANNLSDKQRIGIQFGDDFSRVIPYLDAGASHCRVMAT